MHNQVAPTRKLRPVLVAAIISLLLFLKLHFLTLFSITILLALFGSAALGLWRYAVKVIRKT